MITQLQEQLSFACKKKKRKSLVDVTMPMQVMFNNRDRNIVKATIRNTGPERDAWLILVVGLRSDILSTFTRFDEDIPGRYLACDILGIVPAISLMASSYSKGLVMSTIARDDVTRLVLVFEGQSNRRGGALRTLSTAVYNFMKKWEEWIDVLLGTLKRDPLIGEWNIDIREFLAGESGYITMPWFTPMSYGDRAIGLERIILASHALMSSVLGNGQLADPMVVTLKDWLNELTALPEVVNGIKVGEEVPS
ncbi:MAG: hypothetical protein ACXADC_09320 [Candidatus Thorarchaeota archaeon]|jgi:hypothetical protein